MAVAQVDARGEALSPELIDMACREIGDEISRPGVHWQMSYDNLSRWENSTLTVVSIAPAASEFIPAERRSVSIMAGVPIVPKIYFRDEFIALFREGEIFALIHSIGSQ